MNMLEKIQDAANYLRAQFPGLSEDDAVLIAARLASIISRKES